MGKQKQPVRAWAVIFWLLVWQLASMALRAAYPHGALLLASPADAAKRLAELSVTADFWRAVARSAAHILGGFLLSCALAVVLAALAARLRRVEELLAPLVAAIKAVPVASFIILALVWLSSRSLTLFISALMVFPPVYLSTLEGIRRTDRQLLEMARVYRVPLSRRLAGIYVPQVLPYFRSRPVLEGGHRSGGHRPERRHDRRAALHRKGLLPDAGSVRVDGGDRADLGAV